jgi:hypothetical protein
MGCCSDEGALGERDEENQVYFGREDSPFYGAMQYQINYRLLSVIYCI